jgi:hypothetical protein
MMQGAACGLPEGATPIPGADMDDVGVHLDQRTELLDLVPVHKPPKLGGERSVLPVSSLFARRGKVQLVGPAILGNIPSPRHTPHVLPDDQNVGVRIGNLCFNAFECSPE